MIRRAFVLLAVLVAIASLETGRVRAQARQILTERGDLHTLPQPLVLAGPDVGFRVLRMDGPIPVGQVVVRINGVWVAAEAVK